MSETFSVELALEALDDTTRSLVHNELSGTEGEPRAVRSRGHYSQSSYALDVDKRTYHGSSAHLGLDIEGSCGETFRFVSDDTAAVLLSPYEEEDYIVCDCTRTQPNPPMAEPPSRIVPLINAIRDRLDGERLARTSYVGTATRVVAEGEAFVLDWEAKGMTGVRHFVAGDLGDSMMIEAVCGQIFLIDTSEESPDVLDSTELCFVCSQDTALNAQR